MAKQFTAIQQITKSYLPSLPKDTEEQWFTFLPDQRGDNLNHPTQGDSRNPMSANHTQGHEIKKINLILAHQHELKNILLRSSPKCPAFKTLKLKEPGCTLPPRSTPMSFHPLRLATRGAMGSSNSSQDNPPTLPPSPLFSDFPVNQSSPAWLVSFL